MKRNRQLHEEKNSTRSVAHSYSSRHTYLCDLACEMARVWACGSQGAAVPDFLAHESIATVFTYEVGSMLLLIPLILMWVRGHSAAHN